MGNGALPSGPSYRAHPRLYLFGHAAISELSLLSEVKRKLDFEPATGGFWREAVVRRYSYPALVDVAWCARIEPSSAAAWEIGLPMRF